MTNKFACSVLTLACIISLSGCMRVANEEVRSVLNERKSLDIVTYNIEGKDLNCIKPYSGGLSCNWEEYNKL